MNPGDIVRHKTGGLEYVVVQTGLVRLERHGGEVCWCHECEIEPAKKAWPGDVTTEKTLQVTAINKASKAIKKFGASLKLLDEDTPKVGDPDPEKTTEDPPPATVADGYHLDAERIGTLLEGGSLGDQLEWLRFNDYPVPMSTGRKARTAEMLSAIMKGDYEHAAADSAFGPLKWPEVEKPATCPECGSETPEDCDHELP